MESVTTTDHSARAIARRIIDHAEQDSFESEYTEKDFEYLIEEHENAYDSDDPRSFGGKYYWDDYDDGNAHVKTKLYDRCRLVLYYLIRTAGFILLILQHFFGFNRSRFQWALDLAEEEKIRRENSLIEKYNSRQRDQDS